MNRIIITLGLLVLPIMGFCDTLNYWHVYYNDSVIAKFNSTSSDLKIEIDASKITEGDSLSIRHWNDTPCFKCSFLVVVKDEKKRKLKNAVNSKFSNKLSFGLRELFDSGEKSKSKRYDFNFWEEDENENESDSQKTLILRLVFTKES